MSRWLSKKADRLQFFYSCNHEFSENGEFTLPTKRIFRAGQQLKQIPDRAASHRGRGLVVRHQVQTGAGRSLSWQGDELAL